MNVALEILSSPLAPVLSRHRVLEAGTPKAQPSIGVPPDAQEFAGRIQSPCHGAAECVPFILLCCNEKGRSVPTSCASRSQQASPTTPSLRDQGLPHAERSRTEDGNGFHKALSSFPASWLRVQSSATQFRVSAALYVLSALLSA